jgi:hypothetical protein
MFKRSGVIAGAAFILFISCIAIAEDNLQQADVDTPDRIFNERIMPIFRSTDPSSCVQCHLSAVDLKNYILPSHEKTFLSLRDQGLINLEKPSESKILQLIKMGDDDADKGARLIHEEMRQVEYQAFAAWITACCQDEALRNLPQLEKAGLAKPVQPEEVIRHSRKSRVVDSFIRNVWSQRMRCFPCHTPHEISADQQHARDRFEELENEFGDQLEIFKKTPEATLENLIELSKQVSPDELPLINIDDPTKSLLLLKPTSKLPAKENGKFLPPSYAEPITHMGGLKMHEDDQSYKSFVAWLEDYARVVKGKYKSVSDLPADNWHATQRVLRVADVPLAWKEGTVAQLFVYGRSHDNSSWNKEPIAFTQGTVTPKKMVNGSLFLLAPLDAEQALTWQHDLQLAAGNYLIRIYVDAQGELADDPAAFLSEEAFVGAIELKNARWLEGFKNAELISAQDIQRE